MLSLELESKILNLSPSDTFRIIILTGKSLRHQRFALRIQQEFPQNVIAWYQYQDNALVTKNLTRKEKLKSALSSMLSGLKKEVKNGRYFAAFFYPFTFTKNTINLRHFFGEYSKAEKHIFESEIHKLKSFQITNPIPFTNNDLRSGKLAEDLKAHNAYFLLTMGGPIYPQDVLNSVDGICINQHAGHSPDLKGSYTTEWAIYHRVLEKISSTIHITTADADAGPIIKRSQPCFGPNDTSGDIFCRVVALGNELLIDTVRKIIQNQNLIVYPQIKMGKTKHSKEFTPEIALKVKEAIDNQFVQDNLMAYRNF